MKKDTAFDLILKITSILLSICILSYMGLIIYNYYCKRDEIIEIHLPQEGTFKVDPDDIIRFEDATREELERAGFIDPTQKEEDEIKHIYSVEPPIQTPKNSISA